MLTTTPLTHIHRQLGAKMVDFAGFEMPVSYTGIKEEHQQVRTKVGVFDVSHMGEFIVRGRKALDLLQHITTNDVAKLNVGDAQYSCLPNGSGGIVDDLLIYRLPEDRCADGERAYMLVVNAANIEKDWNWISQHHTFDKEELALIDISSKTGLLAVQGPLAAEVLQPHTPIDLGGMKYYTFKKGAFAGLPNVLVSATGYTGSGGFEIYADVGHLESIWAAIFKNTDDRIAPVGLGARDTLRLEMGYCLYGNDIDDTTSPIEAGLGWITKTKKGDFIDRDLYVQQRQEGIERKLVGFTVDDRRVPRFGYPILNSAKEVIGKVTSGTLSPTLGTPIGMGYVATGHASPGTEILIDAGRKQLRAVTQRPPFVKV